MITLCCPSRRPDGFERMWESAKRTAVTEINYLSHPLPEFMPTVHKWNLSAKATYELYPENKLFMLAADDMIFETYGWDKALLDHYNALENKIHCYALQDSRDKDGTPHPVLTREWIEAMGWFLPPYFLHWEVDQWTVEIAKANKCFTHLRSYLLRHEKTSDIGKPDQTHLGIRQMGWRGRDAYVASSCRYLLQYETERLSKCMSSGSKAIPRNYLASARMS